MPGNARIRALAQVIACDIYPVQNLKILARLRAMNVSERKSPTGRTGHRRRTECLRAIACSRIGVILLSEQVTLADVCLVPQLVNARRFGVALKWPRLLMSEAACMELAAFQRGASEQKADAE